MSVQATRLSQPTIRRFASQLLGTLVQPGDMNYDQARQVHNGMIDRHPRLIVHCKGVADVIAAVNFAREQGLQLAVRGGGHSFPGYGTCDDGLVIDLRPLHGVRVDAQKSTVQVEGGSTWGEVDQATHAYGLAVPGGVISTSGVGGLTLGGGHGHLSRKYGLTIDNLQAADVVLADGRFVTASASEYVDLFWALRGGGGNFGVVTSFMFQAHPVSMVFGGPMFWSLDQAQAVIAFYQDFITGTLEELSGFFVFAMLPPAPPFPANLHLQRVCGIIWCYAGPLDKAEDVFEPVRRFGPPALDLVGPLPFPALNSLLDGLAPPGLRYYTKGDFFHGLSDKAIALHLKYGAKVPNPESTMHIYPIDGAVQRMGGDSTAFSFRSATFSQAIVGVGRDAASGAHATAWVKDYWLALHPHSAGGAYVNFMMDEGQERVMATFGRNFARLGVVKNKYDPNNLFSVNQNIRPVR